MNLASQDNEYKKILKDIGFKKIQNLFFSFTKLVKIGNYKLSKNNKPFLIAEISANNGDHYHWQKSIL